MTVAEPLLIAGVGGALCALDAAPLAQTLLSQPLPAAVLTGALLRCENTAAPVGIALQVLWTALLPLGGSLIPDSGPAMVGAVAAAALLLGGDEASAAWAAPICFLVALGAGMAGARTVMWARRWNHTLLRSAELRVIAGDVAALERSHAVALGLSALRGAGVALATALAGWSAGALAARLLPSAAPAVAAACHWALPAGIGVLAAAAWMRTRKAPWLLAAGAALACGIAVRV